MGLEAGLQKAVQRGVDFINREFGFVGGALRNSLEALTYNCTPPELRERYDRKAQKIASIMVANELLDKTSSEHGTRGIDTLFRGKPLVITWSQASLHNPMDALNIQHLREFFSGLGYIVVPTINERNEFAGVTVKHPHPGMMTYAEAKLLAHTGGSFPSEQCNASQITAFFTALVEQKRAPDVLLRPFQQNTATLPSELLRGTSK